MDRYERLCYSMGGGMWKRRDKVLAPGEGRTRKKDDSDEDARAQYKYLFYADFLAPVDEPNSANAIQHLQEMTTFFRVLGSYPREGTIAGLENLGPRAQTAATKAKVRQRLGVWVSETSDSSLVASLLWTSMSLQPLGRTAQQQRRTWECLGATASVTFWHSAWTSLWSQ